MLQRSYRPLIPLLLASLLGCAEESAPLDQQLYVWQRQWRPAHAEALAQSRADFSTLRVLALQAQPQAGWSRARIDVELLRRDARPLIAVVRLDGQLPQLDPAEIGQQLAALVRDWQAAGLRLSGLEIDHDCATSRLPAYAELLREVRRQLPAELRLSITALPAWLVGVRSGLGLAWMFVIAAELMGVPTDSRKSFGAPDRVIDTLASKDGRPVVEYVHPGGHEFPAGAAKRVVEFLKANVGK